MVLDEAAAETPVEDEVSEEESAPTPIRKVERGKFRLTDRTLTLTWPEGHELEGLEVTIRRDFSLEELQDSAERQAKHAEEYRDRLVEKAQAKQDLDFNDMLTPLDFRFQTFGDETLLSWNIEYPDPFPAHPELAGQPVPATGEGMRTFDRNVAEAIIAAASQTPAPAIPLPLEPPSDDGEQEPDQNPTR